MKIKKLLPFIMVIPSLIGCKTDSTMKAPEMEKYTNEVTYTEFLSAWTQAKNDSVLLKADLIGSAVLTTDTYKMEESKEETALTGLTTGEKVVYDFNEVTKFDAKNLRYSYQLDYYAKQEISEYNLGQIIKQDIHGTDKKDNVYQFETINGTKHLVEIKKHQKTYSSDRTLDADDKEEEILDKELKDIFYDDTIDEFNTLVSDYSSYKWYLDDNNQLFTIAFNQENEDAGSSSYKRSTVYTQIAQIRLTDKKIIYKINQSSNETITYTAADGDYQANDVVSTSTVYYGETILDFKDVKINKIDLKNYTAVDFED